MIASEPLRIPAADGYALGATVFRPPATRAVTRSVVICSAMGVKRAYYFPFAEYLAERGLAAVTFDYRGIGSSAPDRLRGFDARLLDWGRLDIPAVIDWTAAAFPGRGLSVVGHSVGGQLFGLVPNLDLVADVLAVGAQSGYWGHWPGAPRLRLLALWFVVMPLLPRLLGYFPSRAFGLGESLPAGVAREWAWWGRHPRYVRGRITGEAAVGYERFGGRLRAISASDDVIAPRAAVAALLELYPGARREQRYFAPADLGLPAVGHFGYFLESVGERLWPDEVSWLTR